MRILYLHQYFTTPDIGGGTRSYEFGRRLVKNGHDVEFISGPISNNLYEGEKYLQIDGMKINIVGRNYSNKMAYSNRIFIFLAYALAASLKGVRLKKPDIIYATSTPLTVAVPAIFLSWFFKTPFVFEVRDLWPEAPIQMGALKNPFLIKIMRKLESLTYHKAVHLVVLSPGMAEAIKQTGIPENKITVIPNSSDIELFSAGRHGDGGEILNRYGIATKNVALYAGTIGEANGLDMIMNAAKMLQEAREDVHFIIAGDGKRLQALKRYKEVYGLENITFTGNISKHQVAQLYRVAKVSLVLLKNIPIFTTSSPNKFFDTLAAGTPVISNIKGWIERLIKENNIGLFFEGEDASQLVKKVLHIVKNNTLQKEMAGNARRLAKKQFDRDKLAVELEKVLIRSIDAG